MLALETQGLYASQNLLLFVGKIRWPERYDHCHGPNYEQRVYGVLDEPCIGGGGVPEVVATMEQSRHQNASARTVV